MGYRRDKGVRVHFINAYGSTNIRVTLIPNREHQQKLTVDLIKIHNIKNRVFVKIDFEYHRCLRHPVVHLSIIASLLCTYGWGSLCQSCFHFFAPGLYDAPPFPSL